MGSYYGYSYVLEDGLEILAGVLSGFPVTAVNIAGYVLTALALYTLAQRRGLRNAWLAWVPILNCWLVGSLSDQYRYVAKGEYRSKRTVLLVLRIVMTALITAMVVCGIAAAMNFAMRFRSEMIGIVIAECAMGLALAGISIAHAVVYFMALNDIFHSMDPENSTLFLLLSIFFSVTEPFFLFFNRNKDLGMPPRRDQFVRQEPVWQQPEQEPWEQEEKDYL